MQIVVVNFSTGRVQLLSSAGCLADKTPRYILFVYRVLRTRGIVLMVWVWWSVDTLVLYVYVHLF